MNSGRVPRRIRVAGHASKSKKDIAQQTTPTKLLQKSRKHLFLHQIMNYCVCTVHTPLKRSFNFLKYFVQYFKHVITSVIMNVYERIVSSVTYTSSGQQINIVQFGLQDPGHLQTYTARQKDYVLMKIRYIKNNNILHLLNQSLLN